MSGTKSQFFLRDYENGKSERFNPAAEPAAAFSAIDRVTAVYRVGEADYATHIQKGAKKDKRDPQSDDSPPTKRAGIGAYRIANGVMLG